MKKLLFITTAIIAFAFIGCIKKGILDNDTIIILPRESWNAIEPKEYKKHKPNKITIHHEGTYFPQDSLAFRHIKNIQIWGMRERKWADVPYHFFIDGFGNIIEGRDIFTVGETNTSYDPTGHILISIIGEYHKKQKLNEAQYKSLIKLIEYLRKRFEIKCDEIRGHRDYCKPGETDCPGDNIYELIISNKIKNQLRDCNN
ncbi:MAG: peptidoglycan recognition protein family protein [Ignavibacteria bacterium]|nr:peptidoglycan recognition protein family protein [Ignavibacteria bacterium]